MSGFKKKGRRAALLPSGTRPSVHNAQLLCSTGVPSLDALLGGGLAVGSILLVEQDRCTSYGRMLQRYFVAEGVQHGHAVAVVDADIGADALLAGMPSLDALDAAGAVTPSSVAASAAAASHATAAAAQEDEMKIAWRYRDVPVIKDELGASAAQQTKNAAAAADADDVFCHSFDRSKSVDSATLQRAKSLTTEIHVDCSAEHPYNQIAEQLSEQIKKYALTVPVTEGTKRPLLRIALSGFGSPLMGEAGKDGVEMIRCVRKLRRMLRTACAVCVMTSPVYIWRDSSSSSSNSRSSSSAPTVSAVPVRLIHACDAAVELTSFAGRRECEGETGAEYKDYHGIIAVHKQARLNALSVPELDTRDLAFKVRRRRFAIERFHLPPEGADTQQRGAESKRIKPADVAKLF